jgi:nucleotide-binding universal stress UspA family protein
MQKVFPSQQQKRSANRVPKWTLCSFRDGVTLPRLIEREARKWGADVIVIGARGAGGGAPV